MRSPPIHHPAPPPGVAACTSRKCTFWLQLYLPESGYRSPVFLAILETHISGAVELLREFSGRVCKKRSELQHGPPLILGQVLRWRRAPGPSAPRPRNRRPKLFHCGALCTACRPRPSAPPLTLVYAEAARAAAAPQEAAACTRADERTE